jgi:hypothetical protein
MFLLLLGSLSLYSYSFTMTCDKTELMLGEKTHLTLTLRYSNLEDYDIEEPKFEDLLERIKEDNK